MFDVDGAFLRPIPNHILQHKAELLAAPICPSAQMKKITKTNNGLSFGVSKPKIEPCTTRFDIGISRL